MSPREWLLWHVPDWFLLNIWAPVWKRREARKARR